MDTMLLQPEIVERAERKVREFEVRHHTTLAQLSAVGLPGNADYAMHEDYIEWHHWARVASAIPKGTEYPPRGGAGLIEA